MKKLFLLVTLITLSKAFYAQNIGIGTNVPNASAILDITSTNKGVLFPKVLLLDVLDNTTIPNAAPNLIVYNYNTALPEGKGLYINNGTVFPRWEKIGNFKLPYSGTTVTTGTALSIDNTGASSLSTAIQGYSANGAGVKGISNAGTGVLAYSGSGNALEVSGKIKIAGLGQVPGAGKVLTSDADGNASWQNPETVAFASYGIQANQTTYPDNVTKKVAFQTEEYDLGNNYNPSGGSPYSTFTAPFAGIYHFDVLITWAGSPAGYSYLSLIKEFAGGGTAYIQNSRLDCDNDNTPIHSISIDAKLNAGDKVYVNVTQSNQLISTESLQSSILGSYFTGHLVIKL